MTSANFAAVMDEVFAHEGGYVNDPKDPGGETNMGISKRSYPGENIRGMTRDRAAALYRRDFWTPIRGDDLPAGIDMVTMDPAVNSGLPRGVKWLQRALAVPQDGKVGAVTLAKARSTDPLVVIPRACAARMGFLRGLGTWGRYGKGWSRRVARVEAVGVAMAAKAGGMDAAAISAERGQAADATARRQDQGAATSAAGGAGTIGFGDLPDWALAAAGIAALVLIVILISRARHNRERAEAYRNVAVEA